MRTTKNITSAGDYLNIPIDDNDQTASLTLSGGSFSGIIQLVGLISNEGREIELTAFNPDGTVANLDDPLPLDIFIDVAGYKSVRVILIQLDSGSLVVTSLTTSAKRIKLKGSSDGTGQEVQITNFPIVQAVSGPFLTNQQLRATPVPVIIKSGIDSDGNPLPDNFCSYPSTYNYTDGLLTTMVKTIDPFTYTKTFTYDMDENVKTISQWVKS